MLTTASASASKAPLSHNLVGQRLGRKGRDTRERIIAATHRLLNGPPDTAITLSAVAREASLAMTGMYLYFSDLSQLLGAVLEPVMESAESAYLSQLRSFWPDERLGAHCREFVAAYHAFWVRHTRILHLRNSYADNNDAIMRRYRDSGGGQVIRVLVQQMRDEPSTASSASGHMAAVLLTGVERTVTVVTDPAFPTMVAVSRDADPVQADLEAQIQGMLAAEARVLELAIADRRGAAST